MHQSESAFQVASTMPPTAQASQAPTSGSHARRRRGARQRQGGERSNAGHLGRSRQLQGVSYRGDTYHGNALNSENMNLVSRHKQMTPRRNIGGVSKRYGKGKFERKLSLENVIQNTEQIVYGKRKNVDTVDGVKPSSRRKRGVAAAVLYKPFYSGKARVSILFCVFVLDCKICSITEIHFK